MLISIRSRPEWRGITSSFRANKLPPIEPLTLQPRISRENITSAFGLMHTRFNRRISDTEPKARSASINKTIESPVANNTLAL